MKFSLTITTGNDQMQTSEDIADALRRVADRVEAVDILLLGGGGGPIRDVNGAEVGSWGLSKDDD